MSLKNVHLMKQMFVQGDDNEEYVYKNIQSAYARSGAIFLDYRNNKLYTDPYSLLYGHHVIDGLMFSDVVLFGEEEYFNNHKWGRLWLPENTFDIELFGCITANGWDEDIFNPNKYDDYGTLHLVSLIKEHSVQWREMSELTAPITDSDRIIGFSTCTDMMTDGRVILYGVLRDAEFEIKGE